MKPEQLALIPSKLLYGYRNTAALEKWLAERNMPRPSLADIDAERRRRQRGKGKRP